MVTKLPRILPLFRLSPFWSHHVPCGHQACGGSCTFGLGIEEERGGEEREREREREREGVRERERERERESHRDRENREDSRQEKRG